MRVYEVVVVLKPVGESQRKKLLEFVKVLLKDVKITKEDDLGSKALAYKIKGELSGHYYDLMLEGESFPSDFEKKLMENEEILRHLVLRIS